MYIVELKSRDIHVTKGSNKVTLRILIICSANQVCYLFTRNKQKKLIMIALINLQRGVTPPYREVRIVFPKQLQGVF